MVGLQEQNGRRDITWRPAFLATPFSGHGFQFRIRGMPVLHINHQLRISQHAGVAAFEPIVPPTYGFIAPLDTRAEIRVVGESVVPRSDDRFDRRLGLFEHRRNAVAVTILQTANQEAGNRDLAQRVDRDCARTSHRAGVSGRAETKARLRSVVTEFCRRGCSPVRPSCPAPCPCSVRTRRCGPCHR